MKKNERLVKNFCKFENCDFNMISQLFKTGNFKSMHSSMWNSDYVLNSTFQIRDVQNHVIFQKIYNKFNEFYKLPNHYYSNLDIFFSFAPGTSSSTHKDNYSVGILAAYNDIIVRVEDQNYILNQGDLISINANETHQVIGINPRVILSYGYTIKGEKL
jgi:hypothetical protein|tara:strand:+ start:3962 stop:4438 length:477 start_codon:yes stop_codon:yes gene_type:complete